MFVSVDLPIPGEPPSSTSDPGTRPPPSTRSSSPMPVDMRLTAVSPTSVSGRGPSSRAPGPAPGAGARAPAPASSRGASRRPLPRAFLDERVPRLTARALAMPLRGLKAALRAAVDGVARRHRRQPTRGTRSPVETIPPQRTQSHLRSARRSYSEHVAPAPVGHLPDSSAHAHEPEAAAARAGRSRPCSRGRCPPRASRSRPARRPRSAR